MTKKQSKPARDLYAEITNQLISAIEAGGELPWAKTWEGASNIGISRNLATKAAYTGINTLMGVLSMAEHGFKEPWWGTFKQVQALGGTIKKGSKGTLMVRYLPFWKEHEDDEKPLSTRRAMELQEKGVELVFCGAALKGFVVFNYEQTEGIEVPKAQMAAGDTDAEALLASVGVEPVWGYNPCYRSTPCGKVDQIYLPTLDQFKGDKDALFATAAHELVHWTGHPSRLARHTSEFNEEAVGKNASSIEEYAFEELVAELGASFLCAERGISATTQHAAYLQSWLKALKEDKRFIFQAATAAQKAVDYIAEIAKERNLSSAA